MRRVSFQNAVPAKLPHLLLTPSYACGYAAECSHCNLPNLRQALGSVRHPFHPVASQKCIRDGAGLQGPVGIRAWAEMRHRARKFQH